MNITRSLSTCFLALLFALLAQTGWAGQTASSEGSAVARDGQHDFDFSIGSWKTQVRRLLKPLSGSTEWVEGTGTVSTRKVWNGRADLEELTMDTPAGRLEGVARVAVRHGTTHPPAGSAALAYRVDHAPPGKRRCHRGLRLPPAAEHSSRYPAAPPQRPREGIRGRPRHP